MLYQLGRDQRAPITPQACWLSGSSTLMAKEAGPKTSCLQTTQERSFDSRGLDHLLAASAAQTPTNILV